MHDSARWDRWIAAVALGIGVAGLVALPLVLPRLGQTERVEEPKVAQRSGSFLKLGARLAEQHGIKTEPARRMTWTPRLALYGRVVANPRATAEIRAPFAGVLRSSARGWPRVGAHLGEGQQTAVLQARFSPQERLDLQSKAAEAEEKLKGAEEVVKVQQERVQRLSSVAGNGIVPRTELEQALVQLAEARAQRAGAQAQAQVWQHALKSIDSNPIAVPLTTPLEGEVTEIAAQPGTPVEAGAPLLKLVDFRHVLIRLDVPAGQGAPPQELDIALAAPDAETRLATVTARRAGPAPSVDPTSQYAGYLYEADGPARDGTWRPGLFVQALVADPAAGPSEAVVVAGSALLYHQGRALVYVQVNPGRFERREVALLGREGEMVFLGRGVRVAEEVVVQQAQLLLSEEFRGDADDD